MAPRKDKGLGKPKKKRRRTDEIETADKLEDTSDSSSSLSAEDEKSTDSDEEAGEMLNEEVNIDFEGFPVETNDFDGIKLLLQQQLITLSINISELAELITAQNYLGTTLKMTDDDDNTVYGITTLLDLHKNKDKDSVKKLYKSIQEKCNEVANGKSKKLQELLSKKIGFLINERFINIPVDVCLPMYNSLRTEMEDARSKDQISEMDYFIFIAKSVKAATAEDMQTGSEKSVATSSSSSGIENKKSRRKNKRDSKMCENDKLQFVNPEDEILSEESSLSFSYSVTQATGYAVSGHWNIGDNPMNTYRTVMFIKTTKFNDIINKIESMLHH